MNWNEHFRIKGKHAFLSPSNFHWLKDDPDKLRDRYFKHEAVALGTRLHALAE